MKTKRLQQTVAMLLSGVMLLSCCMSSVVLAEDISAGEPGLTSEIEAQTAIGDEASSVMLEAPAPENDPAADPADTEAVVPVEAEAVTEAPEVTVDGLAAEELPDEEILEIIEDTDEAILLDGAPDVITIDDYTENGEDQGESVTEEATEADELEGTDAAGDETAPMEASIFVKAGELDKYMTIVSGAVKIRDKVIAVPLDADAGDITISFDAAKAVSEISELSGAAVKDIMITQYSFTADNDSSAGGGNKSFFKDNSFTNTLEKSYYTSNYITGTKLLGFRLSYKKASGDWVHAYSSRFSFVRGGKCGTKAFWEFDEKTGAFTVSGTGEMQSYAASTDRPWNSIMDKIKSVSVADGITTVGQYAFYNCSNMTSVSIPDSVHLIGANAFAFCRNLEQFPARDTLGVKTVQNGAFNCCYKLKKLSFPKVTYIGEWAFRQCTALEELYLTSDTINTITLHNPGANEEGPFAGDTVLTLYMKAGTKLSKAFHTAAWWGKQKIKAVQIDISTAAIDTSAIKDAAYAGAPVTQSVVVKDNDYTLVEGTDYELAYKDNAKAGEASVTVKGKGDYSGESAAYKFKISALDISKGTLSGLTDQKCTGDPLTPAPVVKVGSITLKKDTDYTVAYSNNTAVGTATVTVTGKDGCTGTLTGTFKITADKQALTRPASEATPQNPKTLASVENTIAKAADDKDLSGSSFSLLQLQATSKLKKVSLKWTKVKGATSYVIYGNRCGKNYKYKKIATVTGNAYTHSGLKKGTYYKYMVVAVKGDTSVAVSKTIHIATKGGKVGNVTKVTPNKKAVTLNLNKKKKKTFKASVKTRTTAQRVKTHRKIIWESSDVRVAKVGPKGKITAIGKGTCYVYAYAQNGRMARIKVTVK